MQLAAGADQRCLFDSGVLIASKGNPYVLIFRRARETVPWVGAKLWGEPLG